MEYTEASRGKRGAERMQPAGSRKGGRNQPCQGNYRSGDGNSSTGSGSFSYCLKMGKEEKGGKMSSEEVKGWH